MEQKKEDIEISCADCGCGFVWTKKEQEFLQEMCDKKIPHRTTGIIIEKVVPPMRCLGCRTKRKASYAEYNKTHNQ